MLSSCSILVGRISGNLGYDVNVKINEGVATDQNSTSLQSKNQARQDVRITKPSEGKVPQIKPVVKEKFSDRDQTDTEQFKRWFGDWQKHPNSSSKVVNADGTPMVVYHQTGNEFSVFDPMHSGAGTSDNQTPFGIFLKSSDKDIGINGKKQMALYANIRNPLRALNRNDLTKKMRRLSPKYDALCAQYDQMNAEFQKKQEAS